MQGNQKQSEPTENKTGSQHADGDPWASCPVGVPESLKSRVRALANGGISMDVFRGSCIYRDMDCPDCMSCPYAIVTPERLQALHVPPDPEPQNTPDVNWDELKAKIERTNMLVERMRLTVDQLAAFLQHFADLTQGEQNETSTSTGGTAGDIPSA